ncbi:MAG: hypothetical protein ACYSW8_32945 [Planctomycetota bacterium]|jgi:ribosomal protein L37AE/L43A
MSVCLQCKEPILKRSTVIWDQDVCGYIHMSCAILELRKVLRDNREVEDE